MSRTNDSFGAKAATLGAALLLAAATGAVAADRAPAKAPTGAAAATAPLEDDGFEVEDAFGFSQGSAVAGEGNWEASSALEGRFGKRKGTYRAWATETEAEYGLTDRIQAGFALFTAGHTIRGVPELDNRSSFGFDGLSVAGKALILERDIDGPVGLAVEAEGEWHRHDENSGAPGRFYGFGASALTDTVIVPNMLYLAVNGGFEIERGRETGEAWEKESSLYGSAALAWRFTPRATLGAEARLESAFEDVFGKREGTALFLGPTFFWKVSGKVSVAAAWSAQVWGNGAEARHGLNLDAFDRHRAMLKIGLEF